MNDENVMSLIQIYFIKCILPPRPTWLCQRKTASENILKFLLLHWWHTRIIFIIWKIRQIYPPLNDIYSNISFCWNSLIGCTSQNQDYIWNNHLKTEDQQWHLRSLIIFILKTAMEVNWLRKRYIKKFELEMSTYPGA